MVSLGWPFLRIVQVIIDIVEGELKIKVQYEVISFLLLIP